MGMSREIEKICDGMHFVGVGGIDTGIPVLCRTQPVARVADALRLTARSCSATEETLVAEMSPTLSNFTLSSERNASEMERPQTRHLWAAPFTTRGAFS